MSDYPQPTLSIPSITITFCDDENTTVPYHSPLHSPLQRYNIDPDVPDYRFNLYRYLAIKITNIREKGEADYEAVLAWIDHAATSPEWEPQPPLFREIAIMVMRDLMLRGAPDSFDCPFESFEDTDGEYLIV
ncbi:hypothetical protein MMC13_001136 [Lambiella insularis]|nr:hypothetical protein [Lambiella insularis]